MRIPTFRRFVYEDYPDSPSWFQSFLDTLNPLIDVMNPLLHGNIDLDNNILGERQTVTLSHGVPIMVKLRTLTQPPRFVRVGWASGYVGVGAITSYNADGTVMICVYFPGASPPTTPVAVTIFIEP